MKTTDFLIVGGGIVGATIALELRKRHPTSSITLCEKESKLGIHSSTRNSGVIHSGIYYDAGSVKAKVCHRGARKMIDFHDKYNLPIKKMGKLLVCPEVDMADQIELLLNRAKLNGIEASLIDKETLAEIEPESRSASGNAIYVPITSVGDPIATMKVIEDKLIKKNINVKTDAAFVKCSDNSIELSNNQKINFGYFINAAGAYADKIAHSFNVGKDYTMLPFRGLYWQLLPESGIKLNHLVYPVPDLRFPFLGLHTTSTIDGNVYIGPTASPGFGREHYKGTYGINFFDTINNLFYSGIQFIGNKNGFRSMAFKEIRTLSKKGFVKEAKKILPRLTHTMLKPTQKAGVRAQIYDRAQGNLVTDFLAVKGQNSLHILNSISPAWTCSFGLAEYICDNYMED